MPNEQFFGYFMAGTSYIRLDDNDIRFVLDQYSQLDFYTVNPLKQQSAGRYVASLWPIILIASQPVFAFSPICCVHIREAINNNFIVCGLTRPGLEPIIHCTRHEHADYYTTDAVDSSQMKLNVVYDVNNFLRVMPLQNVKKVLISVIIFLYLSFH